MMLRALALILLLALPAAAEPIAPGTLRAVDGDTVEHGRVVYRLIGFDTPETRRAKCPAERALGDQAAGRLRQLVADVDVDPSPVPCSCRAGTEGTQSCNRGRRGQARPYPHTRRNHPTRRNPSDPTFVWYGSRPTAARAMMASVLLIAEDETYVRIVAELVLERAGYETISAGTVAEALAIIETDHHRIDLLFTDLGFRQ